MRTRSRPEAVLPETLVRNSLCMVSYFLNQASRGFAVLLLNELVEDPIDSLMWIFRIAVMPTAVLPSCCNASSVTAA